VKVADAVAVLKPAWLVASVTIYWQLPVTTTCTQEGQLLIGDPDGSVAVATVVAAAAVLEPL
jgi:hypothetical protein